MARVNYYHLSQVVTVLNRLYSIVCFILVPAVLYASGPNERKDGEVKLSDVQVPRYLEARDVLRWDRAVNLKREGESDVESGEWMRTRRESTLGVKVDTTRVRQRGEERIREGREKISQAEATLAELRQLAVKNFVRMMTVESHQYTVVIEGSNWEDFIDAAVPSLLASLWSEGYSRLFFAGAFQFRVPAGYASLENLEDELRTAFLTADDRYSLIVTDTFRPLLVDDGDYLALRLPEGISIPDGLNSALIVMQLVPLENGGAWVASLRGIDLGSGRIVANEIALVPEYVGARAGENGTAAPVASVAIEIKDEAEFLRRVERSKEDFLFSVLHRDRVNADRVSRDLLLFKTLIFSHLNSVISDTDFLMAIRHSDEDVAPPTRRLMPNENAVWLINPVAGEGTQLHARHLAAGTDLKVGTFSFEVIQPTEPD